jgi:hypothetical protein
MYASSSLCVNTISIYVAPVRTLEIECGMSRAISSTIPGCSLLLPAAAAATATEPIPLQTQLSSPYPSDPSIPCPTVCPSVSTFAGRPPLLQILSPASQRLNRARAGMACSTL